MKHLIVLLLLILGASCQEEVSIWDELTEDQKREAIRRATEKCQGEKAATYANFQKTNDALFLSQDPLMNRSKKGWIWTKGEESIEVRTWKRDPNYFIFYLEERDQFGGLKSRLLRLEKADNEEMLEDLMIDHCSNEEDKTITVDGGEFGPLTLKSVARRPVDAGNEELTYTYQYKFGHFAYFARYFVSYKREVYDTANKPISAESKSFTTKFEVKDFEKDLTLDIIMGASPQFCTLKPDRPRRVQPRAIGYDDSVCYSSDPGGWL